MKIAVFTDVHGNLKTLKSVLEQLSSLKNGIFDTACKSKEVTKYDLVVVGHSHQNFENGNVVSVSAAGLEGASLLLIEATEGGLNFERVFIN